MIYDDLDTIAANSFRNFHAKGLDYLCLHRSPELTIKAYFYENAGEDSAEVVCPHDHRYPFSTHILAGQSEHYRYAIDWGSPSTYSCFEWKTPLLGGDGFTYLGPSPLRKQRIENHLAGSSYWCDADDIHTIRIVQPDTVLLLYQHADVVPVSRPTVTFVPGYDREPPNLAGIYDLMPLDVAEWRLATVKSLL